MSTDELKEAKRYRWLSSKDCNQLYVSKNEGHACNYVSAREWIEVMCPEDLGSVPADELERMKQTDTIWQVQIYPDTPIGFYVFYGATLDAAIDAAMKAEGE